MIVSLFNDVIGPVMRGPSSSHCAAALRIGRLARDLMGGVIEDVLVEFDRNGSLPTTHDSQGSDMGLFGGLLGWETDDERLTRSIVALKEQGVRLRVEIVDVGDPHPNTYRLTLATAGTTHSLVAISTGGGMIEVLEVDGVRLELFGDYFETLVWVSSGSGATLQSNLAEAIETDQIRVHPGSRFDLVQVKAQVFVPESWLAAEMKSGRVLSWSRLNPVLPVLSRASTSVPFTTGAEMLRFEGARGRSLWELAVDYEAARGGLEREVVLEKMIHLVRILRRSIAQGLAGTDFDDRVLGVQSVGFQKAMAAGRLLQAGALNRMVLYVTAMMEVKSSMGVIIAMPTAGACAALPGAVIAMAEEVGLGEVEMAKAFLASGIIGVIIATHWTFAAEVGGCQAEGGSAAAMAAAALVTLSGGTVQQAVAASSMALQSMLGLICDPIANRVEAPCLGKNVMAASNALSCANMALAGFDPLIPLDEVIEAAKRVSSQMPRELRCTALGGLSITPTSMAIEQRLAAATAKKCGASSCGCS